MRDVIETGDTVKEIEKAIRDEVLDRVVVEKEEDRRTLVVGFQSGKALQFIAAGEGVLSALTVLTPKEPPKDVPITVKELREKVWGLALTLTVEMEHAKGINKTKLRAKYEGIREVWDLLGGDLPEENGK